MTGLRTLQNEFQRAILHDDLKFQGKIEDTERVDRATRIGIYSHAYRARLIEALQDSFVALHTLVGDDQFDELCRAFIDARRPHHYSIRWYGEEMAEFLRSASPYNAYPYLSELADFGWKLMEAFDAADMPAVTFDAVTAIPAEKWPDLRLSFHPSLRRLELEWSVAAFHSEVESKVEQPTPPARGDAPIPWVIWRKQDRKQYFRSLTPDEAWMLDNAVKGASFSELCEGLLTWCEPDQAGGHAAGIFRNWIVEEMICAVDAD